MPLKTKKPNNNAYENEISNLILVTGVCEAMMKISWMTNLGEFEKLTFNQIKEIILNNIRYRKETLNYRFETE